MVDSMNILNLFKKKQVQLTDDFVELSIGRVYFKPILSGALNRIKLVSTITGEQLNLNLFYRLIEYETLNLEVKEIDNLSIQDGKKVRNKVKDILNRYGILNDIPKEEEKPNLFKKADIEWFNKTKTNGLQKIGAQNGR
jgi:hypothetical protein